MIVYEIRQYMKSTLYMKVYGKDKELYMTVYENTVYESIVYESTVYEQVQYMKEKSI